MPLQNNSQVSDSEKDCSLLRCVFLAPSQLIPPPDMLLVDLHARVANSNEA